MTAPHIIFIRGLPGARKSTLAKKIADTYGHVHLEADDYYSFAGEYIYDPAFLGEAHKWCAFRMYSFLRRGRSVVVANTFTRLGEFDTYTCGLNMVERQQLRVVRLPEAYRSVHGVPAPAIAKMRGRFEDFHGELYMPPLHIQKTRWSGVERDRERWFEAEHWLREVAVYK